MNANVDVDANVNVDVDVDGFRLLARSRQAFGLSLRVQPMSL
ncbi:MAG TPA: hypothetical protein VFE90_17185 [Myxococcales bacterium]|nr:hypothetical protein [Myxococcales bacterium]